MDDIIQLKITLQGTKPPIWRQVLVNKTTTFLELHYIIQITMGWENSHLFEFEINKYRIAEPNEDFDTEFTEKTLDATTITLDSIITSTKEKFNYIYDFGDSWNHQILVEKFLPLNTKTQYPNCINGELNCPPEDCGGIGGFYGLLDIINNKRHPERKEMLEWLGGQFDAEHFDKNEINKELLSFDEFISGLDGE
jgi:hypothetical protein